MFDTISDYPLFGHRYTVMEFQWKKGPSRKLSGFGYEYQYTARVCVTLLF